MKAKPTPIFVPALKSPSQGGTTVRITSRQTEGAYCVCEMTTMPGDGVSRHVHDRDEEFYYILEGVYEMQAGEERFMADAGSLVVIPRDVPHQFRNAGQVPARALMIFRPGGFDELGAEMREAAAAGTLDAQQRQAIFTKWGVHFDEDSRL
ncbi:MAG TPA: cupin domain-containing protein [Verrucomicrobiae bacterium]|jgi:mannose-6-phosphate isomerase-like protein (cupin superfamily)|nr:cupin domain-containing protein [Verrucomicrobiae bacterium]